MMTIVQYPKRSVGLAVTASILLHLALAVGLRYAPAIRVAMGLGGIEYVDADYNRAILIDFSKGFRYPPGFLGFVAPTKIRSLEEIAREEARRARREAARRAAAARAASAAQDKAAAQEKAAATEPPPEKPAASGSTYPGGFGRINTAPLRDQIQRLYQAHRDGLLVIPEGRLRVGVTGSINRDGTLRNYRLIFPSGIPEIDASALAILQAVSESRALGPLHNLTSISLIIEVDQIAQLNVVGFAGSEDEARAVVDLANTALLFARVTKAQDVAAMTMLNNLKVSRSGQRVEAVIRMARQTATAALNRSMGN
ncbi:MAG: energy transducer TonB [Acidobacteriota bacterium]